MKIVRKVISLLLTATIAVGALFAASVTAGAESIYDTAKAIISGKEYEATGIGDGKGVDYKITSTKAAH